MALTRSFVETVRDRAQEDPDFRVELLMQAVDALLAGELNTGKSVLRSYINATIGFQELANLVGKNPKNLMRTFSDEGNPTAENLFAVLSRLQAREGVRLEVTLAQ